MDIKVNVEFKNLSFWKDSFDRSEHAVDRMQLRGICTEDIKEAVRRGAKTLRDDKSIIAEYKWYKVVYREFMLNDNIKKIYPITVMEA